MSRLTRIAALVVIMQATLPGLVSAQGWIRTYGGSDVWAGGQWLEITTDSGFVICGNMDDGSKEWGYLIKTDALGDTLWTRTYDEADSGTTTDGEFHCVQQTTDKGYILVGKALALGGNFLPSIWLMKTDSLGVIQWVRGYGGEKVDKGWFIRQVSDGGYIVAGETMSFGPGQQGLWVLRTDSFGDTIWARTFGGEELDWAYCVKLTSDGNYIVTGGNGTQQRLWLLKIDDSGDTLWTRTYGGVAWGRYVEQTADGGYIVTGTNRERELYLLKTDVNGDSLWSRSYWGGGGANEGRCVHQTSDGGYVIGAVKNYDTDNKTCSAWLLKTDTAGDTLWTRTFAYYPDLYNDSRCVQFTPDGGFVMTGKTGSTSLDTDQPYDVWLIKTDTLGLVGIEEFNNPQSIEAATVVGQGVSFSYSNLDAGFHAVVYTSAGQRIDTIHSDSSSGTVTWGQGQRPGVYFIRELSGTIPVKKVVLIR